jgi:DNA-binding GntR family transcriptional regulator
MGDRAGHLDAARAYERLATQIREQIDTGVLTPGDRLPSETRLAGEAAVSRST